MPQRNIFIHGLFITLRRLPALLWTYAFNLALAFLFSIRLHTQLASILDHSLSTQRLTAGFDLSALGDILNRFHDGPSASAASNYASIPIYFVLYFILVPGTLFSYQTGSPARLSTLFHQGLLHFWRFLRITLLTLIVSALILGPLFTLAGKFIEYVDNRHIGRFAFFHTVAAYAIIFLVASILRLYFDLVEVYTVQLGQHLRRNGRPDRRVRRTLGPALRTLGAHFSQAWPIFLFLTLLGAAAVILTTRISVHMLAQPRVWPTFLLTQLGLFLMLFTRFWQRGTETSLALQNPIHTPPSLPIRPIVPHRVAWASQPTQAPPPPIPTQDPIPNPEPASPSLDEPDPGVFHHDPTKPPQ